MDSSILVALTFASSLMTAGIVVGLHAFKEHRRKPKTHFTVTAFCQNCFSLQQFEVLYGEVLLEASTVCPNCGCYGGFSIRNG